MDVDSAIVAERAGIDLDTLIAWMDREGLGGGAVTSVTLLRGGTQNVLLRLSRGECSYILRRPPLVLRERSNETIAREIRVLAALAQTQVPHPRLIKGCEDADLLGAAFYLMEPIEGFVAAEGMPVLHANDAAVRRRMGFALVEAASAIGSVDHLKVGLAGFGRPEGFLERQVARWRGQLDSYNGYNGWQNRLPGAAQIAAWLEANAPGEFTPGLMHGDFHMSNAMFCLDSGEVAAIVDWELATIGDPLIDLGWLLATWPENDIDEPGVIGARPWRDFPRRIELIQHYRERSARDLAHIEWYAVLACFKMGVLMEGTHARACVGHVELEAGERLHRSAVGLFRRALRWLEGEA